MPQTNSNSFAYPTSPFLFFGPIHHVNPQLVFPLKKFKIEHKGFPSHALRDRR